MSAAGMPDSFSIAALREAAGDDDALVAELVTIFLRIVPPTILRLRQMILVGNCAGSAREAHDLKGSFTLVGATQLGAACAAVEAAARHDGRCPSPAACAALCDRLHAIVAQVDAYAASMSIHGGRDR